MVVADIPPALTITEVMYDPAGNDQGREWIEITNTGNVVVFLPWAFHGGSWRVFDGTSHMVSRAVGEERLRPGESIIVTSDPVVFASDYPNYLGSVAKAAIELPNTSATLKLSVDGGMTWFSVTTYDSAIGAAGDGRSLEFEGGDTIPSYEIGGTPGRRRPPIPVKPSLAIRARAEIAEIAWNPAGSDAGQEWIEVRNTGLMTFRFNELNKWKLRIGDTNHELRYVNGPTTVAPGELFLIVSDRNLLESRQYERSKFLILESDFSLPNRPTDVRLSSDNGVTWVLEDRYDPANGGAGDGRTQERDLSGRWRASLVRGGSPGELTPASPVTSRVLINAFLPHPANDEEEWIELINLDSNSIDLAGWQLDDGPGGSHPFTLSASRTGGTVLLPGGRLRVSNSESGLVLGDEHDQVILRNQFGETVAIIPYADPGVGSVWQRGADGIGRWSSLAGLGKSGFPPPIVNLSAAEAVIIDQVRPTPFAINQLATKDRWHVQVHGEILESHALSLKLADRTGTIRVSFHLPKGTKPSLHRGDVIAVAGILKRSAGELIVDVTNPNSILILDRAAFTKKPTLSRSPPKTFVRSARTQPPLRRSGKPLIIPQAVRPAPLPSSTIWLLAAMLGGLVGLTYVASYIYASIRDR